MSSKRDLRLLVGAVGVSALGDFVALIALSIFLQERSGSGLVVAGLFIAVWCPVIVLAPVTGVLVDRVDSRALLAIGSLAQAAVAGALAFVDSTAAVLALATLLGAGNALVQPAEFSLVPAVAAGDIRRANSYVETSRYLGLTLGPLLGGLITAGSGVRAAMLVDAATFFFIGAAAAAIRSKRVSLAGEDGEVVRARDGMTVLFRDRLLGLILVVGLVSLLFMTASATAEVFFAKDVLDAGDVGYGALITSWTLGMMLGSLVLARRAGAAIGIFTLAAIVVQSAGLGAPTLWLVFAFAAVSWFVGGSAHGLKNVLIRSLIHERVPDRLHGRASAAYNALRNGAELVALVSGGILVAAIGARWTLLLAGGLPLVAGLVGLAVYARMREPEPTGVLVDTPAPTAPPALD